ncbi:CCT domain-containing protein [Artemisia annua]|uniref:CCT domain-containing protein n=1 Tax=Artemisia annua TaxID=35608 RepID=A0A2U1LC73_ARTAN|nr:CCT domain-containing protein [Artemisia annua]
MSSYLSSRACVLDLEHMIKWSYTNSTSRTTSNSSSPSSTLSESSNSPLTIATRKPRTPRKRPNQTYNEAAALLSMACPNIFTSKNIPNFTTYHNSFFNKSPELISVFPMIENPGFLIRPKSMEKPCFLIESKEAHLGQNGGEIESKCVYEEMGLGDECLDDFDTESILDEEIEQGIDSIMGESNSVKEKDSIRNDVNTCYGYPMGLGFGMRNGVRALRKCGDGNWANLPMVDVGSITPRAVEKCEKLGVGKKPKKKKMEELMKSGSGFRHGSENLSRAKESGHGLGLKLDYDAVLNAWSDKGSPLPEEISLSSSSRGDVHARAANIDLFSINGGRIESGATRSMDKKKISDRRPRCKVGLLLYQIN